MKRWLTGAALALAACFAFAQYPDRAIRIVVPLPPGGSPDTIARTLATHLQSTWGQPIVVENRTGGSQNIGADTVAKSAPDGYTWLLAPDNVFVINPYIAKATSFDPMTDLAPVTEVARIHFLLAVPSSSPASSVQELIAYAKAHPGKLNYPSSGVGTVHHLSGELLNAMAGIEMVHVPFRGGASPLTEVLGGRVDLLLETMTLSLPQIQAGKLRALGVTSPERWKALPEVPTVAETVPGYEVNSFIGLGTVGSTPQPIVERLNAEVRRALADPATHQRFVELGGAPAASTTGEMRAFVEHEIAKWRRVIRLRKIEQQ